MFRNDGKSLHNFIKYTDKSLESLNFNLELRTFGNITGDPPPTSNLKIKIFKPIKNSDVVIKISEFLLNVYVLNEFEDADVVLGGKLYDYVYASRPILFLIPQNAFSIIKFCQKFPNSTRIVFIDQKEKIIIKKLNDIFLDATDKKSSLKPFTDEERYGFGRSKQYDKLLKEIYNFHYF